MSDSGGSAARSGFNYQDLATANYFVKTPEAIKVEVEPDYADFMYVCEHEDTRIEHYFEVKKQKDSHFTWGNFKSNVADNFSEIAKEKATESIQLRLTLVTNCSLNSTLNSFVEDLDSVRKGEMMVTAFRAKHNRKHVEALENKYELDDQQIEQLLTALDARTHTKRELKIELENQLKKCHPTRYSRAKEIVKKEISDLDSGTLTRDQLRQEVGFPLRPNDYSPTTPDKQEFEESAAKLEEIVSEQAEKRKQSDEVDRLIEYQYLTKPVS